jgi:hypothetical protein
MSENTLALIAFLKVFWCTIFAYLYGRGGVSHKEIRRYYGALWITFGFVLFGLILHSFSYWFLMCFPLLVGALSLGYGGTDKIWLNITKRLY